MHVWPGTEEWYQMVAGIQKCEKICEIFPAYHFTYTKLRHANIFMLRHVNIFIRKYQSCYLALRQGVYYNNKYALKTHCFAGYGRKCHLFTSTIIVWNDISLHLQKILSVPSNAGICRHSTFTLALIAVHHVGSWVWINSGAPIGFTSPLRC